eukprot:scaffold6685_cov202-Prasinococcus_capsulatus_cf.AAC.2
MWHGPPIRAGARNIHDRVLEAESSLVMRTPTTTRAAASRVRGASLTIGEAGGWAGWMRCKDCLTN